eukprot:7547630-Pyramimonas_sp.AAC.1
MRALRLESARIDAHRAVDLGVSMHPVGNIMVEVMHGWDGDKTQNLALLTDGTKPRYKAHPKAYKTRGGITWERLVSSSGWP